MITTAMPFQFHPLPTIFLMIICAISMAQKIGSSCPGFCTCENLDSNTRQMATCSVSSLSSAVSFSALSPELTVKLRVECSNPDQQTQFTSSAFKHLTHLESIAFVGCKFGSLARNTFQQHFSPSITTLIISSSQDLELSDGWLVGTPNIKHLELSKSGFTGSIPNGRLCSASLESLNISANELSSVDLTCSNLHQCTVCLPKLKIFDFADNNVEVMTAKFVDNMPLLEEFYGQSNLIKTTAEDVAGGMVFQGLNSLRLIDLSWNEFGKYLPNGLFKNLPALIIVKIGSNRLYGINPDTFDGSQKITHLLLTANHIYNSPGELDFLHGLADLEYLDMSGNYLSTIPLDMLKNKLKLKTLRLLYAQVSGIPEGVFSRAPNLETLNLAGNKLSIISAGFLSGLTKLKSLALADNGMILIEETAFTHTPNLMFLYLFRNKFVVPPTAITELQQLKVLYISHNLIKSIDPDFFKALPGLQTVYMDENLLTHVPANAFKSNSNIELLVLSHNKIASMDMSAFSGMPKLKQLDLSTNRLTLIGLSFVPISGLIQLNLAYNSIVRVGSGEFPSSVKELNLAENVIRTVEASAFDNLMSLEGLNLTKNRIKEFAPTVMNTGSEPEVLLFKNPEHTCTCASFSDGHELNCSRGYINDNMQQSNFSEYLNQQDIVCNYVIECYSSTCNCCSMSSCGCRTVCPTGCTCSKNYADENQVARCQDLTEIPSDTLSTSLVILDLTGSQLGTINASNFQRYANLLKLHMNSSGITEVKPNTFQGQTKIQEIYMANNNIQSIDNDSFAGLAMLKILDLQHSGLSMIEAGAFKALVALERLFLNDNNLRSINLAALPTGTSPLVVSLHGNNWACDCAFGAPFQDYLMMNPARIASGRIACGDHTQGHLGTKGAEIRNVDFTSCKQQGNVTTTPSTMSTETPSVRQLSIEAAVIIIAMTVFMSLLVIAFTSLIGKRVDLSILYNPRPALPPKHFSQYMGRTWKQQNQIMNNQFKYHNPYDRMQNRRFLP